MAPPAGTHEGRARSAAGPEPGNLRDPAPREVRRGIATRRTALAVVAVGAAVAVVLVTVVVIWSGRSSTVPLPAMRGTSRLETRAPDPTPPGARADPSTGFPSAATTGVPAGTQLSAYTGPCTLTAAGTVIDAKTVECDLRIQARGVVISRSLVHGSVSGEGDATFVIRDSEVVVGSRQATGIGQGGFTATRVDVHGGNRGINCFQDCTVEQSYVHGQFTDAAGRSHESGVRIGSGSVIRSNTIACDAPDVPPDGGCSAGLTGYGDFAPVQDDLVEGNLFTATTGGFCAYGGSTKDKPYSAATNHVRFVGNVFERGRGGRCGVWGPITSFDVAAPGNVWSGNTFDDGAPVQPAD